MNLKNALTQPELRLGPRSVRQRQALLASGAVWLVLLFVGLVLVAL